MRLQYSVERVGDNKENIRTSYEFDSVSNIRVETSSVTCSVMYHKHDESYSLMIGELALNIPNECANQLVKKLDAEIMDVERATEEVATND